MPFVKDHEPNYRMFALFEERCVQGNKSLLWPDKDLWTLENLYELKRVYGDEAIEGNDNSFEGKLELQLKNASPQVWGIVADLFYIFTLPSRSITYEKKISYIRWAAEKAGYQLPEASDNIWEPLHTGIIHTGIQYHIKFGQILLTIRYAIAIKESDKPKQLSDNPKEVAGILDTLVTKIGDIFKLPPRDMRHIILYFKFPEKYEAIISSTAKENIVQCYSKKFNLDVPKDIDEALIQIRNEIEKDLGQEEKPIHFYDDKYKNEWDPTQQPLEVAKKVDGERKQSEDDLDQQMISILHALKYSKNLILSGPPGTGKTYLANKVASRLVQPQIEQKLSAKVQDIRVVEDMTFYDILALDLFVNNGTYSVPEVEGHPLLEARFTIRPVENPRQSIWNHLQTHTAPASDTVKVSRRTEPFLFDKDENSRWSLTTEGKKYVQQNLSDKVAQLEEKTNVEHKEEDFIYKITFHQSFAYEDFIEGIRPRIGEDETGEITYEISPGVFSEVCKLALNDPENKYILIIDEINRGNISKIFGELITLIEDDKRETMSVNLPYSKREFSVPKNLYLIGTMNTADRSIALMDVALRRRFTFIEIMPRPDLLEKEFVTISEVNLNLAKLMNKLNKFIEAEIDRNHQIGHSYFLRVAQAEQEDKLPVLNFVWNHQLFPLLKEYFYSQNEKLIEFLSPFTDESHEDSFEDMIKEGDDLLFALNEISR